MSPSRDGRPAGRPRHQLPPDDELAAAFGALGPAATSGPQTAAAAPTSAPPAPSALRAVPAPATVLEALEERPISLEGTQPTAGPASLAPQQSSVHASATRQATALVTFDVAQRFKLYRKRQSAAGQPTPTNTEVFARALNFAVGRHVDIVAARRPQPDPARPFGAPVPGRRASSDATLTTQLSFRPTVGELTAIKQLEQEAGATSTSAFLNAVLDAFLPPLPRQR